MATRRRTPARAARPPPRTPDGGRRRAARVERAAISPDVVRSLVGIVLLVAGRVTLVALICPGAGRAHRLVARRRRAVVRHRPLAAAVPADRGRRSYVERARRRRSAGAWRSSAPASRIVCLLGAARGRRSRSPAAAAAGRSARSWSGRARPGCITAPGARSCCSRVGIVGAILLAFDLRCRRSWRQLGEAPGGRRHARPRPIRAPPSAGRPSRTAAAATPRRRPPTSRRASTGRAGRPRPSSRPRAAGRSRRSAPAGRAARPARRRSARPSRRPAPRAAERGAGGRVGVGGRRGSPAPRLAAEVADARTSPTTRAHRLGPADRRPARDPRACRPVGGQMRPRREHPDHRGEAAQLRDPGEGRRPSTAGPVVTQYEVRPERTSSSRGSRASPTTWRWRWRPARSGSRRRSRARTSSASRSRTSRREIVGFRQLVEDSQMLDATSRLTFALGRDVSGKAYAVDLAQDAPPARRRARPARARASASTR